MAHRVCRKTNKHTKQSPIEIAHCVTVLAPKPEHPICISESYVVEKEQILSGDPLTSTWFQGIHASWIHTYTHIHKHTRRINGNFSGDEKREPVDTQQGMWRHSTGKIANLKCNEESDRDHCSSVTRSSLNTRCIVTDCAGCLFLCSLNTC